MSRCSSCFTNRGKSYLVVVIARLVCQLVPDELDKAKAFDDVLETDDEVVESEFALVEATVGVISVDCVEEIGLGLRHFDAFHRDQVFDDGGKIVEKLVEQNLQINFFI